MVKARKTATLWLDRDVSMLELTRLIAKELDWPADPLAKYEWVGPDELRLKLDWETALISISSYPPAPLKDGEPIITLWDLAGGSLSWETQYFMMVLKNGACSEFVPILKVRPKGEPLQQIVTRLAREILAMAKSLKE